MYLSILVVRVCWRFSHHLGASSSLSLFRAFRLLGHLFTRLIPGGPCSCRMLVLFFLRPAVSLDFDFDLIWVFWTQSQQLSRLTTSLVLIMGLVHDGFISLILAAFRHGRLRPAEMIAPWLLGLQWRAIRLDAVCTFVMAIASSCIAFLSFALLFCNFFCFPSDNFFGVGCVCLVWVLHSSVYRVLMAVPNLLF